MTGPSYEDVLATLDDIVEHAPWVRHVTVVIESPAAYREVMGALDLPVEQRAENNLRADGIQRHGYGLFRGIDVWVELIDEAHARHTGRAA